MTLELVPEIGVNRHQYQWIGTEHVLDISKKYESHLAVFYPTGRIGTPTDVAGIAAFLASDNAAFVIGEAINVVVLRNMVL